MAGYSGDQGSIAQKTWEMSNNIETISTVDEIYRYDRKEQQDILAAKPWEKEYVVKLKLILPLTTYRSNLISASKFFLRIVFDLAVILRDKTHSSYIKYGQIFFIFGFCKNAIVLTKL